MAVFFYGVAFVAASCHTLWPLCHLIGGIESVVVTRDPHQA